MNGRRHRPAPAQSAEFITGQRSAGVENNLAIPPTSASKRLSSPRNLGVGHAQPNDFSLDR